ncbi:MAG: DegT/DnrJ/EryC1/StrS family aminotransferase [Anaerolineae bacterium]|nr:MAG: DegT/DnrJ/EryC1/StrS family aminotransferase [Anaerolineae bacterium]
MNIPISKPNVGEREIAAISEVIRSGMIAQGPKVQEFERRFAEYHGVKHAIASTNGTTALQMAMLANGIGAGDEVIIPSFSFFATASSILFTGAKPVFADIDPETFNLDPASAESVITEKTKAIMPVHLYGQAADMPAFEALAKKHGLILLEDAAQSHGAKLEGRFVGTWGTSGFSFYPTKNMTTCEGGMLTTQDDEVAERARMIRNHGMSQQYLHEMVGFNFRMTDLMAAMGLIQLDNLPKWTAIRNNNASYYNETLKNVIKPLVRDNATHVYHQYTIRMPDGVDRDEVMKQIQAKGVGVRVYYPLPIHRQPIFEKMGGYENIDLPQTEKATREVMSLPIHPLLTEAERERVAQVINEVI